MLRWTWRELETYCFVVARQFSTLLPSGDWRRSYGADLGAGGAKAAGHSYPVVLRPSRQASTLLN